MKDKFIFPRTVKADFKMGFKLPFLLAVFGVTIGFCFDNWETLRQTINMLLINGKTPPSSVIYFFFNAFSFGGVFSGYFAAIMAAIPFAANYCYESDGGMTIYKIFRCGKYTYARSKFLVASMLGGLTVFLGGLIFILALASYLPLVTPEQIIEKSGFPFSQLLAVGKGEAYFAIVLWIGFLKGALWASVGLCTSAYFRSVYAAVCAPFIFQFAVVQIGRLLKLPNGLRLDMLMVARGRVYSDMVTFIVTTVVVLMLILLCYRLFCMKIERRIWNVE